jgi:hypothetical protein
MKTGITEFGITGVGTRDAGTSEFSNLKTGTLEFGITGGFPKSYKNQILLTDETESERFKLPISSSRSAAQKSTLFWSELDRRLKFLESFFWFYTYLNSLNSFLLDDHMCVSDNIPLFQFP